MTRTDELGKNAETVGRPFNAAYPRIFVEIGEVVGIALFMGAGAYLSSPGVYLYLTYGFCGLLSLSIIGALKELVHHRPDIVSFAGYAREYVGNEAAFVTNKLLRVDEFLVIVFDVTVTTLFLNVLKAYLPSLQFVSQEVMPVVALGVVMTLYLFGRVFCKRGRLVLSIVKVGVLALALTISGYMVTFRTPLSSRDLAFSMIKENYVWLSAAILPAIAMIQAAIFSHGSTEVLLASTSHAVLSECGRRGQTALRRAIMRMAALNVGTILVLVILVAGSVSGGHLNRFAAILGCIGIYATGRTLRSIALSDSAPAFLAAPESHVSGTQTIVLIILGGGTGVVLNRIAPEYAFEVVITVIVLLSLALWSMIVKCRLATKNQIQTAEYGFRKSRLSQPLLHGWGGPTLLALMLVFVMLDHPVGTYTVPCVLVLGVVCWLAWQVMRPRPRPTLLARKD